MADTEEAVGRARVQVRVKDGFGSGVTYAGRTFSGDPSNPFSVSEEELEALQAHDGLDVTVVGRSTQASGELAEEPGEKRQEEYPQGEDRRPEEGAVAEREAEREAGGEEPAPGFPNSEVEVEGADGKGDVATSDDGKIKCPACDTLQQVSSGAKNYVCSGCGATNEIEPYHEGGALT